MEEANPAIARLSLIGFSLIAAGLLFFSRPADAQAATLFLSPSSGSPTVSDTFSVNVDVSSTDRAINAFAGTLKFSSQVLEVVSLSKSGSVASLWVQDPSYSNDSGTINFEGVVLSPGFTGSGGKILTIAFRAKAAGAGLVSFTSGSVLANDGQGTNILSGLGSATYTVTAAGTTPSTPPPAVAPTGVPAAPTVTSSTNPNQQSWYNNGNPSFAWSLPSGTTGVNVLADHNPTTDPGTHADGVFSTYTYQNVQDGTWYFHIKLQNSFGWGPTTHFEFQVDRTPPTTPSVTFDGNTTTSNPTPGVFLSATDALSGVSSYLISIDGGPATSVAVSSVAAGASYPLPSANPGLHTASIKAEDAAGNTSTAATVTYTLLPPTPSLVTVQPGASTAVLRVGNVVISNIEVFLATLALLVLLMLLLWIERRRKGNDLVAVQRQLTKVERLVHSAFDILREDMRKELKMMEKAKSMRELTKEEEKISARLRKDIDLAEKMIGREIEGIERMTK